MPQCMRCNTEKPESAFYRRTTRPAWAPGWCRNCQSQWYHEQHKQRQETAEAQAAARMEIPDRRPRYSSAATRQRAYAEQQERHRLNDEMHIIEDVLAITDPDAEWMGLLEWDAITVNVGKDGLSMPAPSPRSAHSG
jgi:hypothetical protein